MMLDSVFDGARELFVFRRQVALFAEAVSAVMTVLEKETSQ